MAVSIAELRDLADDMSKSLCQLIAAVGSAVKAVDDPGQAASTINELLCHRRYDVRFAAAVFAKDVGNARTAAILLRMICSSGSGVKVCQLRGAALKSYVSILGLRAIPLIADLLSNGGDLFIRGQAIGAANQLPESEAIKLWRRVLFDEQQSMQLRHNAALCLAYRGVADGAHLLVPDLRREIGYSNVSSICALASFGNDEAVRLLGRLISDPESLDEACRTILRVTIARFLGMECDAHGIWDAAKLWLRGKQA